MFDAVSMLKDSEGVVSEKSSSIYLGNIPWRATPQEIGEAIFAKTNVKVKDVRIVKEKGTGRSRGFAFVDIYHPDANEFIRTAPEIVIAGRTLTVKYANERKSLSEVSPVSIQEKETEKVYSQAL